MKQSTLRNLYCMRYETFCELMGSHSEGYILGKWNKFRENLANFLMELDENNFQKFVEWSDNKDANRKQ